MPFYEYECQQCGKRFDAMLSISNRDREEKKLTCPECGARQPRRLISSFAALSTSDASCPASGSPACGPGG